MILNEILHFNNRPYWYNILKTECSNFIIESKGLPLIKKLNGEPTPFKKVKVRYRKNADTLTEILNISFHDMIPNFSKRIIEANSRTDMERMDIDSYYVFPINDFKFVYNTTVSCIKSDYKPLMDAVNKQHITEKTSSNVLKHQYRTTDLYEGLTAKAEILVCGIPYFYALNIDLLGLVSYSNIVDGIGI